MTGKVGLVAVPEVEYRRRQTMQQDDIQATFAQVLENVAKVDRIEVARDKHLREDLGIDSLSLIEVAVAAEDVFGILIPDEDLERFQTVSDVVDYIQRAKPTT
jgi:acyl carrier protein